MKTLIQRSLALVGFELRRKGKSAFDVQRSLCPKPRPVISDVGAHVGETSTEYRRLFPDGKIYAFELFPESFLALRSRLSRTMTSRSYNSHYWTIPGGNIVSE
jgi:hypothetical protein